MIKTVFALKEAQEETSLNVQKFPYILYHSLFESLNKTIHLFIRLY